MEKGTIIKEQYTIVEHVGRGGMADVWSARDHRLNRMVAIKTIAVGLTQDIDPVALFQAEAQTIARMEHPHILPIYDFGEYQGSLYIVMRYVTGGSLERLMVDGGMPPAEVLRIGQAIASALDYAHANKIVHLDLKPPNILMDSGGAPYLADFGLATVLDPEGRAKNPGSGTLLYMAPEQLTAEMIDYRADLYSFCIMLFHMLTGRLPFDGMYPLALRQVQFGEVLPALEDVAPHLPAAANDILRRGTAKDPELRPKTLQEVIEALQAIFQVGSASVRGGDGLLEGQIDPLSLQTERLIAQGDSELLEAVSLYSRARAHWAGGQGRFLLGLTHYLLVAGYYGDPERYGLVLDTTGAQMLLRGALEYDVDVDKWWAQLDDQDRRLVCLHTVRSGSTPARVRAFYRLETLPDDPDNPLLIPRLVAQALEVERDEAARIAAITVLKTRARLLKPTARYDLDTRYRGNLLDTMARVGIELRPPAEWREAVYSPEIDLMLAEQALDQAAPAVAEAAARAVGTMHSLTAARALARAQRDKRPGALQALAFVRDEVPSLPSVVSPTARLYAWLTNTARRLVDRPLDGILRFVLVLLGAWIAVGQQVYITYRSQALFTPQRWGNTIAIGLVLGLFIALMVMFADEFSRRLQGFWTWWLRLLVSSALGILLGMLTWAAFTWFYLGALPSWDLMRLGGVGLAFGFVLAAVMQWQGWRAIALATLSVYLPIFAAYRNQCQQLYLCYTPEGELLPNFSIAPIAVLGLLLGALVGSSIPRPRHRSDAPLLPQLSVWAKRALSAGGGLLWSVGVWLFLASQFSAPVITWDTVTLLFLSPLLLAMVLAYLLPVKERWAFFGTAVIAYALLYSQNEWAFAAALVAPQRGANYVEALFSYDQYGQVFTVALPVAFTIALGGYVLGSFRALAAWIGAPRQPHEERNAWLAFALLYSMVLGAIISVFALFSVHKELWWGIGWSASGFALFVAALATWRWARWGAHALLLLSVLFVAGGVLFDLHNAWQYAAVRRFPPLFEPRTLLLWGAWTVVLGIAAWGALRRALWGGVSLVVLLIGWYVATLFGLLFASVTVLAVTQLALMAFALAPAWQQMETGRWQWRAARVKLPAPVPAVEAAPFAVAPDLRTELDAQQPAAAATDLRTEVDPQAADAPAKPKLKIDTSLLKGKKPAAPDLRTEVDPQAADAPDDAPPTT